MSEPELSETETFGVPAICSESQKLFKRVMKCEGYLEDEVLLVSIKSPSEEGFHRALNVWEMMRASIRPRP